LASENDDVEWRNLDTDAVRQAAIADPTGFVDFPERMVIDEIQRVPGLLLAIKEQVDEDPRPGRFLPTGSARVLGLRDLPDSLPGRTETIELWPFSQGEIDGQADGFVDAIFSEGENLHHSSNLERRDYAERVVLPLGPDHKRRFAACGHLPRGGDAGTVQRYLGLLEEVFLIKRIPAWVRNIGNRAVGMPKLAFVDSGLATDVRSPAGRVRAHGGRPPAHMVT
jgi:uncharacterized protein